MSCIGDLESKIRDLFGSVLKGDEHEQTRNGLHYAIGGVKGAVGKLQPLVRDVDSALKQSQFSILEMTELLAQMSEQIAGIAKSLPVNATTKLDVLKRLLDRAQTTGSEALHDSDVEKLRNLHADAQDRVSASTWGDRPGLYRLRTLYASKVLMQNGKSLVCQPMSGKKLQCMYQCVWHAASALLGKRGAAGSLTSMRKNLAECAPA